MSGTSDKSPIYRLYGVVVHLDVMNAAFSGHYVCYVRNSQNKWFKIDDSTVCSLKRWYFKCGLHCKLQLYFFNFRNSQNVAVGLYSGDFNQ